MALQEPVILHSNEVVADSPPLPDLGELKFAFDVTVHNGPPDEALASSWAAARCPAQGSTNIDCTVFDYVIRNLGSRAVRNATFSCSDSDIRAEYAVSDGAWKPVPVKLWACWNNYLVETKILPGGEIKGEFMLTTLAPPYSTVALRAAGQYQLRFIFEPRACIASPDASFCLVRPKKQPPVTSQQIALRTGGGG